MFSKDFYYLWQIRNESLEANMEKKSVTLNRKIWQNLEAPL